MKLATVIISCCFFLPSWAAFSADLDDKLSDFRFISHIVDPRDGHLALVWRDNEHQPYQHFQRIRMQLAKTGKSLRFAMNAGIFQEDLKPLGLYIEQGKLLHRLSLRQHGYGNFYIQPNGVFSINHDGEASIMATDQFKLTDDIDYATQSGPMLIHNGQINRHFNSDSTSLKIRNGVGLLPDGRVIFVLSRYFIRFYDFAEFFQSLGCEQALYLDGSVSRVYLPEQGIEQDGVFGPMIIEWAEQ